jgi:hypothetical protein
MTSSGCDDVDAIATMIVEDDVRHAFQDAMREAVSSALLLDDNDDDHGRVELFMKSSVASGKRVKGRTNQTNGRAIGGDGVDHSSSVASASGVYDHMHIGMRSNRYATRLIEKWQGKHMTLSMQLPPSFVNRLCSGGSDSTTMVPSSSASSSVDIVTGKLFLDYADVMLPKGRLTKRNMLYWWYMTNIYNIGGRGVTKKPPECFVSILYLLNPIICAYHFDQLLLVAFPWSMLY